MLKRLLIAPIRFYQRFLSPLKRAPSCRYLPTCSSYAIEAIERRGVLVGSLKALGRLLRCNPLFRGGYDPVEPLLPRERDSEASDLGGIETSADDTASRLALDCAHDPPSTVRV